MVLLTMIARLSDGMPLVGSLEEDDQVCLSDNKIFFIIFSEIGSFLLCKNNNPQALLCWTKGIGIHALWYIFLLSGQSRTRRQWSRENWKTITLVFQCSTWFKDAARKILPFLLFVVNVRAWFLIINTNSVKLRIFFINSDR